MRLELDAIDARRGAVRVLHGLSLAVGPGEVLCVMGRNGAGKTTALEAIMGAVPLDAGTIRLDGARIDGRAAHAIPRLGIGYVPQGRRLFGALSVAENLDVALLARDPARSAADAREAAVGRFPLLRARLGQAAATLSGGEQQMLAIARALCLAPSVLLLDEPSEGLQPSMRALIDATVCDLRASGTAILLVEHRVATALAVADRIAFIARGRCVETCDTRTLAPDAPQFRAHLGV